ncbi:MAG: glycosyltransferase [Candidatus Aenigmatarchaeota archaeon]
MPFSVIIPVFNEEKIIEKNTIKLIRFLNKLKENYEIIIVSNGSTDKTVDKGKRLEKKYSKKVRFFHLDKRGVGLAFRHAITHALYNNLISMDMDLSTELDFIPNCLKLLNSNYSMIIGSKNVGKQQRSFLRRFISNSFIFLVRSLLKITFMDYSIGAKGYKRNRILRYINFIDNGSSYVVSLAYMIKKDGLKIIEIPTNCLDKRKSKFNLIHEIFYRFKSLVIFWFRVRLLKQK